MNLSQRRRGRPKHKEIRLDKGTPELQEKWKALLSPNQDSYLSESLIGLLFAKGLISKKCYEAGLRYYELGYTHEPQLRLGLGHRQSLLKTLGQPRPQNSYLPEDEVDLKKDVLVAHKWRNATLALKSSGLKPMTLVTHILFSGCDPKQYGAQFLKQLTPNTLLSIRDGLLTLCTFFGL